jgi:HlyD family secretion protein
MLACCAHHLADFLIALGENKQGDITYVATIPPDRQDERLRWNMTAAVSIAAK